MSSTSAPLGKGGPQVSRLGLGLMGLSAFYGAPKPDNERLAFLDQAYALGERNWDTADMYGDNEDLIGKWLAANPGKRENIFLATKFANRNINGERSVDSSPEYAREACEKSLQRLGVDHVDLYYCHRLDKKTPVERTIRALVELKKEGKIKHIGISECSAASLRRAHAIHPITAVQMEYSLFALEIESEQTQFLKTCRELGVAVVAYSPLGRGMLSGNYRSPADFSEDDFRRNMPRWSEENFPKNLKLVDEVSKLAKKKGCTPAQIALAWLLAQGEDIFVIPGTTSVDRLKENLGTANVQLTDDEAQHIRELTKEAEVSGDRYPGAFMGFCFADTPEEK